MGCSREGRNVEILCQKLGQRPIDRQSTQTRMRMVAGGSALPLDTPNKEQNSTTTAMGKIGHILNCRPIDNLSVQALCASRIRKAREGSK